MDLLLSQVTECHFGGSMAKQTFNNLDEKRKEEIYKKLKEYFEEEDLKKISVSGIVKKLDIARGSFYQYFESLEDCYDSLLQRETGQVHHKFYFLYKENKGDLEKTLWTYRDYLAKELYDKNLKNLYVAKFFLFEDSFVSHGKNFLMKNLSKENYHRMVFTMAIFHQLLKESITRDYSKEEFLEVCDTYIKWLLGGINNESI